MSRYRKPPDHRWFFLRPSWIAWGCMISGMIAAGYAFFNVCRYAYFGGTIPPLWGSVAMAFSTAAIDVILGLAVFWIGWLIREETLTHAERYQAGYLSTAQMVQLVLALISSLALIAVALIGVFRSNK